MVKMISKKLLLIIVKVSMSVQQFSNSMCLHDKDFDIHLSLIFPVLEIVQ